MKSYLNQKQIKLKYLKMQAPNKRIKLSVKPEENMQPLSKINEDPEHYCSMFSGPAVYSENLKHIYPRDSKAIDWEQNDVVPKPGNALAKYKPSATAKAMVERERVIKRNNEGAFDEIYDLQKSIR